MMIDILLGSLTAKEDKLNEIRISAPLKFSIGSYISFTALNALLLLIWHYITYLILVSSAKSLEKFTVNIGSFSQEFSLSFSIYLKQLFILLLFWILLFLLIYGISRLLGGTAPLKSFLSYSGLIYSASSLFLIMLLLIGFAFYIPNVPMIFIFFIISVILFIWFVKNIIKGIKIIQNISAGASFASVVISILILGGVLWLIKGIFFMLP